MFLLLELILATIFFFWSRKRNILNPSQEYFSSFLIYFFSLELNSLRNEEIILWMKKVLQFCYKYKKGNQQF